MSKAGRGGRSPTKTALISKGVRTMTVISQPEVPASGHEMWCVLGRHPVSVPCSSTKPVRPGGVKEQITEEIASEPDESHWLTRWDEDDGEPYGTGCTCDIGADHDGDGNLMP